MGTAAHARARAYIVSELQSLGFEPQIQAATVIDPISPANPQWGVAGTVQNVIARLAGTGGGKAILLVSHYDSVATAPGASDDSSGVATLLETARTLKAGPPLKNDVILLFMDDEEVGLLGGALAFLLDMLVSTGAIWLIWQAVLKLYPQYSAVVDSHNSFFYWLAFIILTVAITAAL